MLFGLPDDADWTDERNWYRANPSLDKTITIDKVRDAFRKAKETPADENMFRQLRLNQWVKQSVRWMPMDRWDECGGVVDEYALEGRPCYAGLDLSSTSDLTAICQTYLTRTKAACPSRRISEKVLLPILAGVLGLPDEDGVLEESSRIQEITVFPDGSLIIQADGETVERHWENPSRALSWTDEMKQEAKRKERERQEWLKQQYAKGE